MKITKDLLWDRMNDLQTQITKLEQDFVRVPLKKPVDEMINTYCGCIPYKKTTKELSLSKALELLIDYTGVKYSPEETTKDKLTK